MRQIAKKAFFFAKNAFFLRKCLLYQEKVVTLQSYSKKETNSSHY